MKLGIGITAFILLLASFAGAQQVTTPTFSPDGGSYFGGQGVRIYGNTAGEVIHYTTDGSTPGESNPVISYPDSVYIAENCILKARAFAPGLMPSEVRSAGYTIVMNKPTLSPGGGAYSEPRMVKITSTKGSTICYTLDGSQPGPEGPTISSGGGVLIDHTCTLRAVGYKPRCQLSAMVSADYTLRGQLVFHVRMDGSNENDGLSWDAAKQTVQSAVYKCIPGDEVWVAAGTYGRVIVRDGTKLYGGFTGNETSRNQRDPNINRAILDGGSYGPVVSCMSGTRSTTVIDGFTIQNGDRAISASGSPTIRNNVITGNHGRACIEFYGSDEPFIMSNNLIFGNDAGGIYCSLDFRASGSLIVNNTFANNSGSAIILAGVAPRVVKNNIIVFNLNGIDAMGMPGGTFPRTDQNCLFGNGNDYLPRYPFPIDIKVDPLFRDAANGDYRLRWDSPCVDAGTNDGAPETDILGTPRPVDGDWDGTATTDIGAYEYTPRPVSIDVLPWNSLNTFRLMPAYMMGAAFLGDSDLDVRDINPLSVTFGPKSALPVNRMGQLWNVNFDRFTDWLFYFQCGQTGIGPGTSDVVLRARLRDGEPIEGTDSVTATK